VEADEDARDADDEGAGEEEGSGEAASDEENGERDRERGDRVVARERGLGRRRRQQQRLRRMSDERPVAEPDMGDDLAEEQTETCREQPGQARDLPPVRTPRPVEEPEREGREDPERDRPDGDEVLELVCEQRVPAERAVEQVEERPVDPTTLVGAASRCG
jgi:hypothetical protein